MKYAIRFAKALWDLPRLQLRVRRDIPKELQTIRSQLGIGDSSAPAASSDTALRFLIEQGARRPLQPITPPTLDLPRDRVPWEGRRPRFSVVINTVNRAALLQRAIDSLRLQRYSDFEVVVVDGPSTDGTEEVLKAFGETIKTAKCPELNLSISRNIGIAHASGDVVAFIDDDAVADPYWLEELAHHYEDPSTGAVGGPIYDHTGSDFQCFHTLADRLGRGHPYPRESSYGNPTSLFNTPGGFYYCTLTGANSSFRRDLLVALGGFDETFAYFLDETDVCLRVVDAGFRVVLSDRAIVYHKYAPSHLRDEKRIQRDFTQIFTSIACFMCTHGRRYHSAAEITDLLEQRLATHRQHMEWHLNADNLTREEFAQTIKTAEGGCTRGTELAASAQPLPQLNAHRFEHTQRAWSRFPTVEANGQRLRLVYISAEYPPDSLNGIGRLTHELASELAQRGHDVHVITRSSERRTVDLEGDVWVHRVPPTLTSKSPPLAHSTLPNSILAWAWSVHNEVKRIDREHSVSVISAPIWDHFGIYCIEDPTLPTIISLHTTVSLCQPHKPHWSKGSTYYEKHVRLLIDTEKWVIQNNKRLLANSDAIIEAIEQDFDLKMDRSRVTVVPHGVAEENGSETHEIWKKLPSNAFKVLYVGRFEHRKGIDLMLSAALKVVSEVSHAEIVFVGDQDVPWEGKQRYLDYFAKKHPEILKHPRIHFLGMVEDGVLNGCYDAADVLVCPSRFESFGLVIVEAMRSRCPVIAFKDTAAREIITPHLDGLLVETMTPDALAASVVELARHPKNCREWGVRARQTYEERFTVARMATETLAAYERFLPQLAIGGPPPLQNEIRKRFSDATAHPAASL